MRISTLTTGHRIPKQAPALGWRDLPVLAMLAWLVVCPLCFGGVDLWARAIGWLISGASLIWLSWLHPRWWRMPRWILYFAGLFVAWSLLGAVPLPAGWIEALMPARIEGLSHTVDKGAKWVSPAYEPWRVLETALTVAGWAVAAAVFAHGARHHDGRRRLIWVILLAGLGVMAVAWINRFTPGHIYTRKIETTGFIGPFTGRNIFADFLVMCSLVGTGFLFERWWGLRGMARHTRTTWLALAIVVAAIGWVLVSGSRGGCLAWAAGIVVFGFALWRLEGRSLRSKTVFIGLFLAAALVLTFERTLIERFEDAYQTGAKGRIAVWGLTEEMASQHGWTGVGLGNFSTVFPRYQHGIDPKLYTHPENSYLEVWAESGWLGVALAGVAIFLLFRKLFTMRKWKDLEWQAGGVAALSALALQAFVDFPLQIPGNALMAMAVVGLVWANLAHHPDEAPEAGASIPSRLIFVAAGLLLIIPSFFALGAEWIAAKKNWNEANRWWPLESRYQHRLVEEKIRRSEYVPAHRLASEFLDLHPCDWKLYYLDGWSQASLHRKMTDAQVSFENSLYWSPAKSETARKAGLFFWPRRPETALQFWQRSLELDIDQPRPFLFFLEQTKTVPGQLAFGRLVAGGETGRLITLVQFFATSPDRAGVMSILQSVLAAPPIHLAEQEQLVALLLSFQMVDEADLFLKGTKSRSDRLQFYRCEVLRRQKKYSDASAAFRALAARSPNAAPPPQAELNLEMLKRKAEADPDDPEVAVAFAWKLTNARRWKEAAEAWGRVTRLWPERSDAFRFQASCLEQQGQFDAASDAWSRYFAAQLGM